ncbi:MAG: DNA polymerase III subunit delta' [Deltaproteobacteria bacterium]|nr:DNA polymerase III subunit delta' [Deltaproteobacteria bacterium]
MRISEIIGHEREINALCASFKGNRFAHAYLFAGPDGVGKRMAARAYAAFLNCTAGLDDSCGVCRSCVAVASGAHQNVIEIWPTDKDGDKDLNGLIKVDAIRDVQSRLRCRIESGMKVVIVEAADRFMPQAANAFLKTLEEPPEATVIFLVTARPFALLPTVLSRCQRVNFAPLDVKKVVDYLVDKKSYPSSEAGLAVRMSEGSISKAMAWLDDGQGMLRLQLAEALGRLTGQDADQALRLADELSKRDDIDEALEAFKVWYRDMAVACNKGGASHEILRAIACYSAINAAQEEIRPPRNANKLLAMETLVLKLAGR